MRRRFGGGHVRKGALKAEEVVLAGVAFLRRCARGKKLKVNSKAVGRTRTLQLRGRRPAGRGESSGYTGTYSTPTSKVNLGPAAGSL